MTTKTKQLTASKVADQITCDEVTKSKGVFTARTGFFYSHGRSAENLIDDVKEVFPSATVIDFGEIWKPFKGGASLRSQAHWFVKFPL